MAAALRTRLLGIAGGAIYWNKVKDAAAVPYVRLQTVSDPRPDYLKGYNGARTTRVTADCYAATHKQAQALAKAVKDALFAPATVDDVTFGRTKAEGPRDLGEDVAGVGFIHRASMDLLVNHTGD